MKDILEKLNIFLEKENIWKVLEILNEVHVHPQYEYIAVYYAWWKSFFTNKDGLIITGAYSGERECKTLIEGLNQLGAEGWKIVNCQTDLENNQEVERIYTHRKDNQDNYPDEKYKYYQDAYKYKYYSKHTYILERKKTPLFNHVLLDSYSDSSKDLNKSPVFNKTREEEALEEYEQDFFFKENLSAKAYICIKIKDLASLESLEGLKYCSKEEITEIVDMEQAVAEEIIQLIKNLYGIEIE